MADNTVENVKEAKYPKQVFLILITEVCERFCFYGLRSVLVTYLVKEILYSDNISVTIYHVFQAFCYFFAILGALISDAKFGKYRIIIIFSLIYAVGAATLSLSAIKLDRQVQGIVATVSLFLISFGTGGIKPCVSSFGGDQFVIPQQSKHLDRFFYIFYLSINIGSTLGTIVVPHVTETSCLGKDTCYSLAYGIPAILMITGLAIFVLGTKFYIILQPKINVIYLWTSCVGNAIKQKCKSKDKVDHWLDRAEPKYGAKFVNDVKATFSVFLVFAPLAVFWALFDQQGSTWVLQGNRMDGVTGTTTIYPGHMVTANSLLVVILIPIFTYGVYPLCNKCKFMHTPLRRIAVGGFIAAFSFICAGLISRVAIEPSLPVFPKKGECHLRIYNPFNCAGNITAKPYVSEKIKSMDFVKIELKNIKATKMLKYELESCVNTAAGRDFKIASETSFGYFISSGGLIRFEDNIAKDVKGRPKVRTLVANPANNISLTYWIDSKNDKNSVTFKSNNYSSFTLQFEINKPYKLSDSYNNTFKGNFEFYRGGYYVVLIYLEDHQIKNVKVHEITKHNSVHILWQLPQYFFITVAEVLISPTALEFAYTQAPMTMKSTLASAWLVTTGIGNLFVIIINNIITRTEDRHQSTEFFIFAALMAVDMFVFIWIAKAYKYHIYQKEDYEDYIADRHKQEH